jgi:predicted DCC family thiol-disulfide oxidoreductase YuxK
MARRRRREKGRNVTGEGPLLLYDGICALCNGAVSFVLKRDRSGAVRFAPLQGETAAKLLAGRPELAAVDSMIWFDVDGVAFTRSAARHLGGGWALLASLVWVIPAALRDALYDLVARTRYRVFGRYDACPVPPSEHRARFLP